MAKSHIKKPSSTGRKALLGAMSKWVPKVLLSRFGRKEQPQRPPPLEIDYSQRQSLGILQVPPEIVLCITDHLDAGDRFLLALTCKALYCLSYPSSPRSRTDKMLILLALERLMPDMFFCHGCQSLHSWKLRWFKNEEARTVLPSYNQRGIYFNRPLQLPECARSCNFIIDNHYALSLAAARLAIKHHAYGDACGLPVSLLNRRVHASFNYFQKRYYSNFKIVDGQLLVHTSCLLGKISECPGHLRYHVRSENFQFCDHISTRSASRDVAFPQIFGRHLTFFKEGTSLWSCTKCPTDICVGVANADSKDNLVVWFDTYRQLGTIHDPDSRNWNAMAGVVGAGLDRIDDPAINQPGSIWGKFARKPATTAKFAWMP